ncbi:MAG: molybdopterin-dependent oxidoreductase [Caldilineaceae bacterium]
MRLYPAASCSPLEVRRLLPWRCSIIVSLLPLPYSRATKCFLAGSTGGESVPEIVRSQLVWEDLNSRITPNDKFFGVGHYNWPTIDAEQWRLAVDGMVENPLSLSLADIEARPSQELVFTLECSGNHGLPFFHGGIGTAK